MIDLQELTARRMELLRAQAAWRQSNRDIDVMRAVEEQSVIDELYGGDRKIMGANADDRERNMILALRADEVWRAAEESHEEAISAYDLAKVRLDEILDARRAYEWEIRDRLALGLMGSDAAPQLGADSLIEYLGLVHEVEEAGGR